MYFPFYLNMVHYEGANKLSKKSNINISKSPKHQPSADSEWKNSVYLYNNLNLNDTLNKYTTLTRIIRGYFNFYFVANKHTKHKRTRMRALLRRLTTKRLFVSSPNIKQTADKASITLHIFDRESKFFKRKLFFIMRLFNKLSGIYNLKSTYINRKRVKQSLNKFYKIRSAKSEVEKYKWYKKFTTKLMVNKKTAFYFWFSHYIFCKWALSIFNIKVNIMRGKLLNRYHKSTVGYKLVIDKKDHLNNSSIAHNINVGNFTIKKFINIVTMLQKLLLNTIKENVISKPYEKQFLIHLRKKYSEFVRQYRVLNQNKLLVRDLFVLERTVLKYIRKVYMDNYFKFDYLLPMLKNLLRRVYNKKIELNLIKLKYLHLNSDLISEAIVTKLRKKKGRILKILRRFLGLSKLPKLNPVNVEIKRDNEKVNNMSRLVSRILPHNLNENIHNIIKTIKYKWVTGIRIEGKGRLTRRFTASRAQFKYKSRGSLRNIEFVNYTNIRRKPQSIFMLRNEHKPNVQYSFANSKKRIGAFGIKTWLSSN